MLLKSKLSLNSLPYILLFFFFPFFARRNLAKRISFLTLEALLFLLRFLPLWGLDLNLFRDCFLVALFFFAISYSGLGESKCRKQ